MRGDTNTSRSLTTVLAVMAIYIFLIVLILVFADQLLEDIYGQGTSDNLFLIPLAIVLPLFLLTTIGYNVIKIIKSLKVNAPGAKFKIRLIMFFVLISLLSSIPQGVLAFTFVNYSMNSLFSRGAGEAISGGVDIALKYDREKYRNLESYLSGTHFDNLFSRYGTNSPDRFWETIQYTSPDVDSIQLFDAQGSSVFFRGDTRAQLEELSSSKQFEGIQSESYQEMNKILQAVMIMEGRGGQYYLAISVVYPDFFTKRAELLTRVGETYRQLQEFQRYYKIGLWLFYLYFAFPIFLLSILLGILLGDEITGPIISLEEATHRIAEGDYSFRILHRERGELSYFVSSFNSMLAELEKSRTKTLQTEKVTAWQEIAQRMAHEIKNPLTPIKLSAQRILRKHQSNPEELGIIIEPAIKSIITEVDNLTRLLSEFRDFSRQPSPSIQQVNIIGILHEVMQIHRNNDKRIPIEIVTNEEDVIALIDKDQIKRVFTNLVKNALDAIEDSGNVFIRVDLVRKGNKQYCRIQVQDTGSGIGEEFHNKVFNPYFTTKDHGTGLGLPIVERIIFDHNGQIWFESESGMGTTFFIDLPME